MISIKKVKSVKKIIGKKFLWIGILLLILLLDMFTQGCSKQKEINIFAAASLTESMKEIKDNYEKGSSKTILQLNLGGSNTLRTQIEQGAPADIFISADKKQYDLLKNKGLIEDGKLILTNSIVLIVPASNPANIKDLKDLTNKNKLVLAQKDVPVGNYTLTILDKLNGEYGTGYKEKVLQNVVSYENDVKKVASKVVLGEADAAFVYKSDITSNIKEKVKVIEIPEKYNVKAEYWIGKLKSSKDKELRNKIYELITGSESIKVFEKYGYNAAE